MDKLRVTSNSRIVARCSGCRTPVILTTGPHLHIAGEHRFSAGPGGPVLQGTCPHTRCGTLYEVEDPMRFVPRQMDPTGTTAQ